MAETPLKSPRKTPAAQKKVSAVSDAKTGPRKKATATAGNTVAAKPRSVSSAAKSPSKSKMSSEKTGAPRKSATRKTAKPPISDEQRYRMIAEAAYYRAESRQFKSDPLRDWIEAEKDIASLLSEGS